MTTPTAVGGPMFLGPDDYATLDEDDFGVPGLIAHEVIGPYVRLRASGPLIMVHDGHFDPHMGIGHHPHRSNERLFYILEGAVDHDDALNGITGHMDTGDLGRLTEGLRGMLHKEWNNTAGPARAFILVYGTDPVPARASFQALRDGDAPRYEEASGVATKELVGRRSPLPVHGDIRRFTDTRLDPGASWTIQAGPEEGLLLFVIEGTVAVDGTEVGPDHSVVVGPTGEPRELSITAPDGARVLLVVHGRGHGLVVE